MRRAEAPQPTSASRTPSQTDRVLLTLRRMVLTGEFRAGERLTELDLVGRLEASRTPVRHAMTRLAHEGLLDALPKGGFRVCGFSIEEVWDAIELRGVLEGTAARLAAERLEQPGELTHIRSIQASIDSLPPTSVEMFAGYVELNFAFHHELLVLSKSPMLMRTLEGILKLPFASPGALVFGQPGSKETIGAVHVAQVHHHSIIEAIAERAGTRAEHLTREHARSARLNLVHALSDPSRFARLPGAALVTLPEAI